ncbi:hypothetical protein D018_1322B, partial [Vibrio parahaemolyticus VP2007-007]
VSSNRRYWASLANE